MIFNVVYALGELAVMFPVSGGFYTYSTRFIDPSWGFAMGWNYVFQWAIVLPLELTVAGLTVEYWKAGVSVAVWITVFWMAIVLINIFGTLGYAEEEFWSSALKLSAIVIFMIIGVVLCAGGGPAGGKYDSYWGTGTWYNPGAFANGFKGVCAVFVTAAFACESLLYKFLFARRPTEIGRESLLYGERPRVTASVGLDRGPGR